MEDVIAVLGFSLVMVILASGCCFYIVQRAKAKGNMSSAQINQFEDRIQTIESRLSDIQDIVISIDDQLKRPSQNVTTPTARELS
ncbi:MAG: hypothetical protein ACO36I_00415 [Candidatus Latescibacterota bacterium]|jgi:hypothetical protein